MAHKLSRKSLQRRKKKHNPLLSNERLTTLLKINEKVNQISDVRELLEEIVDLAITNLDAERGLIILADKTGENLQTVVSESFSDQALSFSRSIVKMSLGEGRTIKSSDLQSDRHFRNIESAQQLNILSFICVPFKLTERRGTVGTLYIDQRIHKKEFGDEDTVFLEALANLASIAISNATNLQLLIDENATLREEIGDRFSFLNVLGKSEAMRRVFDILKRILNDDCTVLITGASGTGKEVIAKAMHFNSSRRNLPFVPINCGALPESLLEAELFGSVKGAFTGAIDKKGLFQAAEGGTIFLDEIHHISEAMQIKLLRVLQDKEVRRVGGTKSTKVDFRLVCASNEDLEKAIIEKRFRQDFYYRINVITIHVPPLKERKEDIPVLAHYFLERFCEEKGKKCKGFTRDALDALLHYDWANNNVRELENEIERVSIFVRDGGIIEVNDLSNRIRHYGKSDVDTFDLSDTMMSYNDLERNYIKRILAKVGGNKAKAARIMCIPRSTLQGKMKKLGLE